MTQDAFKAWWYNEGSQTPYTHHDCEEHTMRMCEIAWNKAQSLAQPEQEPVIDKSAAIRIATSLGWTPQRTWVWLTKVERIELLESTHPNNRWSLLALCEAKLKEKNSL